MFFGDFWKIGLHFRCLFGLVFVLIVVVMGGAKA
jgi:hypothetical protein